MPGYAAISALITGIPTGAPQGGLVGPFTTTANTSADFSSTAIELVSGANTITVPSWAAGVIIVPNPANTSLLTLKGVGGDTGITIAAVSASMLSFGGSPPASFVINASSTQTTFTNIIFF